MRSTHQHGYTHDLFVSYSSRDAEWVQHFLDDLIRDVRHFTDVVVFHDKLRLQPGFFWDEALRVAAADSAILIPVLSPRFFDSEYCQKEISIFLEKVGLRSVAPHRSRVLPVKFLCAAPKDHPLAACQSTAFCSEGLDNIPMEFDYNSSRYREAIRKLAYTIGQLLNSVPAKSQSRPAVYVAADFRPETLKIRDSLAHTWDIFPRNPQALLSTPSLDHDLAEDFARTFVSVHTLSQADAVQVIVNAELAAARKMAKPRLILAPTAPPALLNEGFEWLTSQADLEDRIRRLAEKTPERERQPGTNEPLIYFLCPDRSNKTAAEPLLASLESRGIRVYPSPLDGPADEALQLHVRALDELDGCLIYYGNVSRDWFDSVFLRIAKKIRQRALPSAIFLAPPPTDHKTKDLGGLGLPLVFDAESTAQAFLPSVMGATP